MTFSAACTRLGLSDSVRVRIAAAYSEPHRRYHTLRHLEEVLAFLDNSDDEILLAALFHDVVYDPRRSDNEARSVDLMRELVRAAPDRAAAAVLATQTHRTDDPGVAILLDADLAVLARPPDRYVEYARAIREEYAHVPDVAFAVGRAAVLKSILDRPRIFQTERFADLEPLARENLARELERGTP